MKTSERVLTERMAAAFTDDMIVLADRGLYSYHLWTTAMDGGAQLLWRISKTVDLPQGGDSNNDANANTHGDSNNDANANTHGDSNTCSKYDSSGKVFPQNRPVDVVVVGSDFALNKHQAIARRCHYRAQGTGPRTRSTS